MMGIVVCRLQMGKDMARMTRPFGLLALLSFALSACAPVALEPAAEDLITALPVESPTPPLIDTPTYVPTETAAMTATTTLTATPAVTATLVELTAVPTLAPSSTATDTPAPTAPPTATATPAALPVPVQPSPNVTPSALFDCQTVSQIPLAECHSLVQLYQDTNGAGWLNQAGWLATPLPCEWHGVSCRDGRVVGLDLSSNGLNGFIPPRLGELVALESLALNVNTLAGTIPASLGGLGSLSYLYLSVNQLSGPIPPELGRLANLRALWLGYNQLSGPIPPELGQLGSLFQLFISDNQLAGSVPAELGGLGGLIELGLGNNQSLAGPLPMSLTNLSLVTLQYDGTALCAPADQRFQDWLTTVDFVAGPTTPCAP
jgi:hypothetical protein